MSELECAKCGGTEVATFYHAVTAVRAATTGRTTSRSRWLPVSESRGVFLPADKAAKVREALRATKAWIGGWQRPQHTRGQIIDRLCDGIAILDDAAKTIEAVIEALPIAMEFRFDHIRDLAVATVDARHGYTVEFSNTPGMHAQEYDDLEALLVAALASEPSA